MKRNRTFALGAAAAVAVLAVVVLAPILASMLDLAVQPSPAASPTVAPPTRQVASPLPSPTAAASPTPSGSPLPPGTFENETLGYRVTLPQGYRRARSDIRPSHPTSLGGDSYTRSTEQQVRERCESDSGDTGFLTFARGDLHVEASRNPQGLSPTEWVTTPRHPASPPLSMHQRVERLTINGLEAVRLFEDNARAATMSFYISANGRMYEVAPMVRPLDGASLDDIAKTFVAVTPGPFPSPTATPVPQQAAQQVANSLASAFAAKDVDAVGRLIPDCWLYVTAIVNGRPAGGVQYRSVPRFLEGLRARFAAGDLEVIVDRTMQADPRNEGMYFVRSEWRGPGGSLQIHLSITLSDGRWIWSIAESQDGWPCRRPGWTRTPAEPGVASRSGGRDGTS